MPADKNTRPLEYEKYEAVRSLSDTLNKIVDLDVMMETILTEARRFVRAEAGSIYGRSGNKLVFSYSQNDWLQSLPEEGRPAGYKNRKLPLTGNSLASYVAREKTTLNIADAYDIPLDKPYRFEPEFDRRTGYVTRSVLTMPLNDIRGENIGVLQVINPLDDKGKVRPFEADDEELMSIFSSTAAMALERTQMSRQMILRTIKMVELRDPLETVLHALRVGDLSAMLYECWAAGRNLNPEELRRDVGHLRMAAMLHDVGKIGVPDNVLTKHGRLNPQEMEEMRKHVEIGLKLFEPVTTALDAMIHDVILNHHERWDGTGYPGWLNLNTGLPMAGHFGPDDKPLGKKGEEISIFGRVTAVADVFDTLSSRRTYKDAFDEDLVCQIMLQESGHHFDPELIDCLLSSLDKAKEIRKLYPE